MWSLRASADEARGHASGQDTPLGRAQAHRLGDPDARAAAELRDVLVRDAERHEADGNLELALRALEDAMRSGPNAALACEAGRLALALGDDATARERLDQGLELAIEPRLRARCLLLAADRARRVGDPATRAAALRESLRLRPHGAVARELEALQASSEEPPAPADELRFAAALEALCPGCSPGDALPEPPASWPADALRLVVRRRGPIEETLLAAREVEGWRLVSPVARSHAEPSYGALDARETVSEARFEDEALELTIAGAVDEHPDEARRTLGCARAHGEPGARTVCVEAALKDLPPPDSWSRTLTFVARDGRVAPGAVRAGPATQAASEHHRDEPVDERRGDDDR